MKNYVRDPEWEASHDGLPNIGTGVNGQAQKLVGECFEYWNKIADKTPLWPGNQFLEDYKDTYGACDKSELFLKKHHYLTPVGKGLVVSGNVGNATAAMRKTAAKISAEVDADRSDRPLILQRHLFSPSSA